MYDKGCGDGDDNNERKRASSGGLLDQTGMAAAKRGNHKIVAKMKRSTQMVHVGWELTTVSDAIAM